MYGALHLDSFTLAIVAIVAVVTLFGTIPTYTYLSGWGMVPHFVCVTSTTVLMVTWMTVLTSYDWNVLGPLPVIGALILMAIAVVGPIATAAWIKYEVLD